MLGARVVKLAAVALSVVSLGSSSVEATGRVLRSDCPDYDESESASASASSLAQGLASGANDTIMGSSSASASTGETSASASNSSEIDTPESTTAPVLVDVTLFDQASFGGDSYPFSVTSYDDCYELDCFDHKTMSMQWTSSDFMYFGFYLSASCGGGSSPQYIVFTDENSISSMQDYTFKSVRLFQTEVTPTAFANAVSTCSATT